MNSDPQNIEWSDEQLDTALLGQIDTVRHALHLARQGKNTETPAEETLARYLDNSLSDTERGELETLLADNPAVLNRLIALYRETKRIMNPGVQIETVEKHYAAEQVDYEVGKTARVQATQKVTPSESGVENEGVTRPQAVSENG